MTISFVAYIDESGDPGINRIHPQDINGSSEWLILSCFLVRQEREAKVLSWVKEIVSQFHVSNSPHIHFSDLIPAKKKIACSTLAKKPCALFVVMSNKKNIKQYTNQKLSGKNKNWLYWWMMRLLLERVTDFCERHTPEDRIGQNKLRIIFSRRGGMIYKDFADYLLKLYWQSTADMLYIDQGDLRWSVIDFEEIYAQDHKSLAGLQLADVVAGSFYDAVEQKSKRGCTSEYAALLEPRIAADSKGEKFGYGVFTRPDVWAMNLTEEQKPIFEVYGYPSDKW